jgi:hypothetical protein
MPLAGCATRESHAASVDSTQSMLSDAARFVDAREASDSAIDFSKYEVLQPSDVQEFKLKLLGTRELGAGVD